jgi:hypothetical protein
VPAGIPGEHREFAQIEFVDDMLQTAGMFMTAMKQYDSAVSGCDRRRPVTIKQAGVVAGSEIAFLGLAHSILPYIHP